MARRIDIELTSSRPDGSWTWRAAGAREPRGVLDGSLLHDEAKAGDVLRADADFEIDGISIIAVLPPRERHRTEPERIELLTPERPAPGVTTQLVGRTDRRRPGREGRPGREDRPGRDGRPQRDGEGRNERRPRSAAADGDRTGGGGERGTPNRRERRGRSATGGGRPARADEGRRLSPAGDAPHRGRAAEGSRRGPGRQDSRAAAPDVEAGGERRGARRLNPAHVHRHAALDALPVEQRPVAEQLLRGGIPAVRTAIHLEREKASAEGRPAPQAEQLLALAEELLPRLKAAEWRDRAEAASKASDEISLRDLRSVVAGADLARDDETRELAATLRASLERRLAAGREEWQAEIGRHLEEGRIVRAVRLAGRPPEAGARLSGELAARLAHAAGAALNADVAPDRWLAVLEAVVASPVRREVKPAGLPTQASPEVLHAARQQVGRVPALAPMLGVTMPPPPGPSRPAAGTARAARRPPRGPAASRPRPPAAAGTPPAPDEPDAELAPPDLEERGRGATTEAGTPTSPEADTAEPDSPPHDATTEADGDPHDAVAEPPGASDDAPTEPPGASDDAPTDPPSARDDAVAEPPSAPEAEASEPASAPEAEASEPDSAPDDATGPPPGEPGTDGASTEPAQADS